MGGVAHGCPPASPYHNVSSNHPSNHHHQLDEAGTTSTYVDLRAPRDLGLRSSPQRPRKSNPETKSERSERLKTGSGGGTGPSAGGAGGSGNVGCGNVGGIVGMGGGRRPRGRKPGSRDGDWDGRCHPSWFAGWFESPKCRGTRSGGKASLRACGLPLDGEWRDLHRGMPELTPRVDA